MSDLAKARSSKLDELKRCPACGSERLGGSGSLITTSVFFVCGSKFSTAIDRRIEPVDLCPASSMTAAEALNDEVALAIRSGGKSSCAS